MYRSGIIFGLITQLFISLAVIIVVSLIKFDEVGGAFMYTYVAFCIASVIVTSFAFRNFKRFRAGKEKFNNDLAIATGFFIFLPNFVAGTLVLVGRKIEKSLCDNKAHIKTGKEIYESFMKIFVDQNNK